MGRRAAKQGSAGGPSSYRHIRPPADSAGQMSRGSDGLVAAEEARSRAGREDAERAARSKRAHNRSSPALATEGDRIRVVRAAHKDQLTSGQSRKPLECSVARGSRELEAESRAAKATRESIASVSAESSQRHVTAHGARSFAPDFLQRTGIPRACRTQRQSFISRASCTG